MVFGIQQFIGQGFVAGQQQQTLTVGVKATDGVYVLGEYKIEVGQGGLAGLVGGELAEGVVGFVEEVVHRLNEKGKSQT